MINEEARAWLVGELLGWADTYEDDEEPEELLRTIAKLEQRQTLTVQEHEEIIFHLWQQKGQGENE